MTACQGYISTGDEMPSAVNALRRHCLAGLQTTCIIAIFCLKHACTVACSLAAQPASEQQLQAGRIYLSKV